MLAFAVIAFLAAFGLVCTVWTLFGFCIPKDRGTLLYRGPEPVEFTRRYLWLRGLGFLRCPMVMVDTGLADPERQWLEGHGIEICGPEELNSRLGIGAERN